MHQTKFYVLTATAPGALVDNIPVPHGSDACDGSIATWRSGACQVKSVYLSIPFSEVGDFVYHCHILEHEDGGMMAHIRVVPYQ
jgi:FtsP/CotA-like multicopper oxidase with cupredoxin domain